MIFFPLKFCKRYPSLLDDLDVNRTQISAKLDLRLKGIMTPLDIIPVRIYGMQ